MRENKKIKAIKELALDALETDGEHHKQWYLEEILKVCRVNVEELRKNFRSYGEKGIAP